MPKRESIYLSDDLRFAAGLLQKRRKYRTFSEYVASIIRYDGTTQREHHITAEWVHLSGPERDALDAVVLRQVEKGVGLHRSWFEEEIRRAVRELDAEKKKITPKAVAQKIARRFSEEEK